jgi:hypothetical protein
VVSNQGLGVPSYGSAASIASISSGPAPSCPASHPLLRTLLRPGARCPGRRLRTLAPRPTPLHLPCVLPQRPRCPSARIDKGLYLLAASRCSSPLHACYSGRPAFEQARLQLLQPRAPAASLSPSTCWRIFFDKGLWPRHPQPHCQRPAFPGAQAVLHLSCELEMPRLPRQHQPFPTSPWWVSHSPAGPSLLFGLRRSGHVPDCFELQEACLYNFTSYCFLKRLIRFCQGDACMDWICVYELILVCRFAWISRAFNSFLFKATYSKPSAGLVT